MAVRKRLYWAAGMLAACAALVCGYRLSEGFARFVANGVSRPAAGVLMRLSGRVGTPLAELIVIAGAVVTGVALMRAVYRQFRGRRSTPLSTPPSSEGGGPRERWWGSPLSRFCETTALTLSALLLSYVLLWSAQLHAPKLSALEGQTYATADLSAYCAELIQSANSLSATASGIDTLPTNVKFARYPELMRALGMGGVYIPWTGETIISELEPNLSLPFIAAHESAHAQGYAREDEANYVAYQTCKEGGVRSRYSGAMYALYYCMEALHDRDAAEWNRARADMNQAVQRDYYRLNGLRTVPFTQSAFPWRDAAVAAFGENGQAKSYGDVVDLLMADRAAQ